MVRVSGVSVIGSLRLMVTVTERRGAPTRKRDRRDMRGTSGPRHAGEPENHSRSDFPSGRQNHSGSDFLSLAPGAKYHGPNPMITLSAVTKTFDGKRKVTALQGVDLQIAKGEMVSL